MIVSLYLSFIYYPLANSIFMDYLEELKSYFVTVFPGPTGTPYEEGVFKLMVNINSK